MNTERVLADFRRVAGCIQHLFQYFVDIKNICKRRRWRVLNIFGKDLLFAYRLRAKLCIVV